MYITQHTYKWKSEFGTTIIGDSKTVPGEAYSIQDLLNKANGGIPLSTLVNIKEEEFDKNADFDTLVPEPDHDIVDVMELHNHSQAVINEAQQKIMQSRTKKKPSPKRPKGSEADDKADEGAGQHEDDNQAQNEP